MAEHDSTTNSPEQWEWLSELLSRPFCCLDSFINLMDDNREIYENVLAVLVPLVERIKSDHKIIEEVLAQSFGGHIRVELTIPLDAWREYTRGTFKLAVVKRDPAGPQA